MSGTPDNSGKALLRNEFSRRIRECVSLRDWNGLENWAKQWILMDSDSSGGFKWLARASVAQNKLKKAAYAYGRLLDFEPDCEEAKQFFTEHPSILADQPSSVQKAAETPSRHGVAIDPESLLTPDQRRLLASTELELAQHYEKFLLFAEGAARYKKSFDWQPSQAAALGTARCLHRCQKGLEALRFLREQIHTFADWVDGRLLAAKIHLELGQRTEAQAEWQRILKIAPDNREALNALRNLYTST